MESLKDICSPSAIEQFARAFVVKMLTCPLGRSLEFSDEKHINALTVASSTMASVFSLWFNPS